MDLAVRTATQGGLSAFGPRLDYGSPATCVENSLPSSGVLDLLDRFDSAKAVLTQQGQARLGTGRVLLKYDTHADRSQ